jgi:hypothetical protein
LPFLLYLPWQVLAVILSEAKDPEDSSGLYLSTLSAPAVHSRFHHCQQPWRENQQQAPTSVNQIKSQIGVSLQHTRHFTVHPTPFTLAIKP